MYRALIAIAFTLAAAIAAPAYANDDIFECRYRTQESNRIQYSEECITKQQGIIARLRAELDRASAAIALAHRLAENPAHVLELPDLAELRDGDTPFAPRFQRLYNAIRYAMYPGETYNQTDSFRDLRARYSDPAQLRAFYTRTRDTIIGKVALASLRGMVADTLADSLFLFEKPLPIVAGIATRWYSFSCFEQESDMTDSQKAECVKLRSFAVRFKEAYGVEPTRSTAYVLGWLYRRHLEGGNALVEEWQNIGKDLHAAYRRS